MDDKRFDKSEDEADQSEEEAVDLNRVFGEQERDLNSMFPDREMRKFLRQVDKNRRSNERFLEGIGRGRLWEDD